MAMLDPTEVNPLDREDRRALTGIEMGHMPLRLVNATMYALKGSYPVLIATDIDQDDIHHNPSRILYRTSDHGTTWEPVGRYVRRRWHYVLQWFAEAD